MQLSLLKRLSTVGVVVVMLFVRVLHVFLTFFVCFGIFRVIHVVVQVCDFWCDLGVILGFLNDLFFWPLSSAFGNDDILVVIRSMIFKMCTLVEFPGEGPCGEGR